MAPGGGGASDWRVAAATNAAIAGAAAAAEAAASVGARLSESGVRRVGGLLAVYGTVRADLEARICALGTAAPVPWAPAEEGVWQASTDKQALSQQVAMMLLRRLKLSKPHACAPRGTTCATTSSTKRSRRFLAEPAPRE